MAHFKKVPIVKGTTACKVLHARDIIAPTRAVAPTNRVAMCAARVEKSSITVRSDNNSSRGGLRPARTGAKLHGPEVAPSVPELHQARNNLGNQDSSCATCPPALALQGCLLCVPICTFCVRAETFKSGTTDLERMFSHPNKVSYGVSAASTSMYSDRMIPN